MDTKISEIRRNYRKSSLSRVELNNNPIEQFNSWFENALEAQILEPNAMVIGTNDGTRVSARTVLLKEYDDSGFVFYTNYRSRKSFEISVDSSVSLLFPWYELERQIIILGKAERVSKEESRIYFKSRPFESQIGAWVSEQSQVIQSRKALENRYQEVKKRFIGRQVPLPESWGGFRVYPFEIEFWQGREGRLHDRFRYVLSDANASMAKWTIERLSP
tara:strand:- start:346 stop:999 length:654 start_codon:yes stop_codon:yes gene_type:complete